ncbi:peptidase M1 [Epilithonimonas hominis]|uniref:Peptidase M1 n=1 Tax=Epilithonimonas hominis TaxID=420404 RepID=A0A3N0XBN2_9FLAO|nr:M1 family metallopeptidase [Chryseobacterium sp. NEB161]ROI14191.1 peptidase M1 [Epilithonimonas hominis]
MRLNSLLVIITLSTFAKAQEIKSYNGKISIDSLKILNADFKIHYSNSNESEFYFNLNKNAKIEKIEINKKSITYKTENDTDFMPDFKKIIIKNNFPKNFNLEIKYSYPLNKIEHPTFIYNPNWIELSLYTGWFPLNFNDKNYSYKLDFETPENYEIISSGNISKSKNKTIILNNENYKDIPVILSNKFQIFSAKNESIKFYGTELSKEQIKDIQNTSDNIYNFYEKNFGKSDSKNLIVAINPFAHPMSYARKGFISLSLKNGFSNSDKKTLAHEIGHLWWKNASFGTYEEWLNESFAEFSALKWMQQKLSPTEFDEFLRKYETAYQKPIKISQINPNDDSWYSIVYFKCPYILYKLERKIGNEKMIQFLKTTYESRISNTKDLLKTLRIYTDENTVNEFKSEIF